MPELIVHGDVLLTAADAPALRNGAVLVRDGAVAEIGDRDRLRRAHPDADEIGGAGMLVMPGLINAHHHGMGLSTVQLGFPDPGPPEAGLRDAAFESWMATMLALDGIDPYLDTLYKDVLLIESGVTGHLHMHFPSGLGSGEPQLVYAAELEQTLRAHREAGQRVTLAPHWRDRSRLVYDGDAAFIAALPDELQGVARALARSSMPNAAYVETISDLVLRLRDDPLLQGQLSIMAPQWASDELVSAVGNAAAGLGAGIHLHALESPLQRAWGETSSAGRELERLVEHGVLMQRSALAHGVWLRDADIDLLARVGATVVHNASSNARLANGIAPLRALVAAGVSVALGLDDMGFGDDDDMLSEIRLAHTLQRVHGNAEHPRLDAADAFGLVWDGGSRVIGAEGRVGRLEPGLHADAIVIDLDALSAPFAVDDVDVWELLLTRGRAAHVSSTIVGGRVLMRDRVLTHIDRAALVGELAASARSAVAGRDPARRAEIDALGRRIVRRYG